MKVMTKDEILEEYAIVTNLIIDRLMLKISEKPSDFNYLNGRKRQLEIILNVSYYYKNNTIHIDGEDNVSET